MDLSFKKSELIIYAILLFFLHSTIGHYFWGLFGVGISGLDYLTFGLFAIIVFSFKKNYRLKVNRAYLLLIVSYSIINAINLFITDYLTDYGFYLVGFFISVIPFFVFILFSNISLDYKSLKKLIKYLYISILTIVLFSLIDSVISGSNYNNIYWTRLLKTSAFIGTLCVINVSLGLFLYHENKNNKYIFGILFFSLVVLTSAILKSLLSLAFVILIFMYLFYTKTKFTIGVVTFFLFLLFSITSIDTVNQKVQRYTNMYLLSESSQTVPRNLLYITSFRIASTNFPFGSGQGTFGSYPVNFSYSDVYRDYGLSNVHGLSKDSALGKNDKPSYLLDTFWSSVLGENGFIAGFIYFMLYLFPILLINKNVNIHIKKHKVLLFLVVAFIGLLFIESLVLSILGQMTFMIFYSGLTGLIYNQLKRK